MTENWNDLIVAHSNSYDPHDTVNRLVGHAKVTELLESRVRDGSRVLDFGCGGGRYVKTLRDFSKKIQLFGYDPAPHALEIAKASANAQLCTYEYTLVNRQYDVVIANFVLCTMPSMQTVVRQMQSVLRPQGSLIICEPNPDSMGFSFNAYRASVPATRVDGEPYVAHLTGISPFTDYYHPKSAYRDALQHNGFTAVEFHEYLATFPSAEWKDETVQAPYLHVCARKCG